MSRKSASVTITGESALLMHRYPLKPVEAFEKKTPEEQAEISAYRRPDTGELYIPGIAIQRAIVSGATYSKGKGRASMQKPAAACMLIREEYVGLCVREYAVDTRAVVVPATRGRIVRHRPRLDAWAVTFTLEWDDALISDKQARQIMDDTGERVGLLDFRPECKGPFGRFKVTNWSAG